MFLRINAATQMRAKITSFNAAQLFTREKYTGNTSHSSHASKTPQVVEHRVAEPLKSTLTSCDLAKTDHSLMMVMLLDNENNDSDAEHNDVDDEHNLNDNNIYDMAG